MDAHSPECEAFGTWGAEYYSFVRRLDSRFARLSATATAGTIYILFFRNSTAGNKIRKRHIRHPCNRILIRVRNADQMASMSFQILCKPDRFTCLTRNREDYSDCIQFVIQKADRIVGIRDIEGKLAKACKESGGMFSYISGIAYTNV